MPPLRNTLLFWVVVPPLILFYLMYTLELQELVHMEDMPSLLRSIFPLVFKPLLRSLDDDKLKWNKPSSDTRKPFTRRIVAVGDLHGDLPNAMQVLEFAGVVDKLGNWTGNVDYFVQTGDIIDRGDDTIALYQLMDKLRDQASARGGTVINLLGNHEFMNAVGDWRYVRPTELDTFGSIKERQRALSKGGIGHSWAENYKTACRLPLHSSIGPPNTPYPRAVKEDTSQPSNELGGLPRTYEDPLSHAAVSFVHGGLSPTYEDLTPFPDRINELSISLLRKAQHRKQPLPHPPNAGYNFPQSATSPERNLYAGNGPLWYRGWALDPEEVACSKVDDVLARTGTRRMVMGHTPDFERIVSRCNGKILIIDTGISHAYGGVLSALSISYTLTPFGEDLERRWVEKEVVTALYPGRQEILAAEEREVLGDF